MSSNDEAMIGGPRLWRSLEEWSHSDDFQEMLKREFPDDVEEWTDPLTRRRFLALMAAPFALAGLGGCSPRAAPAEKIMPYVRQPEQMTPGVPLHFATGRTLSGVTTGVVVKSREGRPIKIEGNSLHPGSLGASDAFAQASLLGLYDPDRSQSATYRGAVRPLDEAREALRVGLEKLRALRGAGLRILTETIGSPTLGAQLEALLSAFPNAKWIQYEPAGQDGAREGSKQAFGEYVDALYDFAAAEVVLSLDADFLACGPGTLRYTRDFSRRRRAVREEGGGPDALTRLYVVESMLSNTGAAADHRLALRNLEMGAFAQTLAAKVGVSGAEPARELSAEVDLWLTAAASDLTRKTGKGIVLAGHRQTPHVHALVHAINAKLKNAGETVFYVTPPQMRPTDQLADFRQLTADLETGAVELLLVLGGNPVYAAPSDLRFADRIEKARLRFHLGLYQDETAAVCHWHLPESHFLESWGDGRAYDGTPTILQPLIAPLYSSISATELLAACLDAPERLGRDVIRAHWRSTWDMDKTATFESRWQKSLQDGIVADGAFPHKSVTLRQDWSKQSTPNQSPQDLEISFALDSAVYDGRFANNGWLQEFPRPLTRLTWDNAVLLSPRTAEKLGLSMKPGGDGGEHGQAIVDMVQITYRSRKLTMPVMITPGHADDAVTVHLGYGRNQAGGVGNGVGFNVYPLRTSEAPWFDGGLELKKVDRRYTLACTQMHHGMEGRKPARRATLTEYRRDPKFAQTLDPAVRALVPGAIKKHPAPAEGDKRLNPLTLYDEVPYEGRRWGMTIDLSACVGCGACVVACQAENNIPIVGKTEVTRGREMHWIRIDRYFEGEPTAPSELKTHFQPVPCMHCEKAPCEVVCPVGATVHSHDGLNDMVYNRCVGTRYCSNNCPYKVRRFNFLQYANYSNSSLKLLHNPEVTVRSRGVMEKCTYCVQRIRGVEIVAERERRPIVDGEIQTACQASCPAEAIVFGDLNDEKSLVRKRKAEPLNYALLGELNTQPRTTYLASVCNPNPAMAGRG